MSDPIQPEKIAGIPAEKAREIMQDRKDVAQANRTPFPGELRDAFSVAPDIKVDRYTVRPFYDGDLDVLQTINHPLAEMAFGKGGWGEDLKTTRGQMAWTLCYLMTTTAENIGKMLECADGMEDLQHRAKQTFSTLRIAGLIAIQKAIFTQFSAYIATVQGFDESDGDGSKKKQS